MRARPSVLLPALVLVACAKTGDTATVEQKIRSFLSGPPFTVEVVAIGCPAEVSYAKGATFECSASVKDAGDWVVAVEMTDEQGGSKVRLRDPSIATHKLEQVIADHLAKTKELKVTADCGAPLRKAEANATFECRLLEGSEPRAVAVVTIKNDKGEVDWALRDLQLVSSDKLEQSIAKEMQDKGLTAKLDCGPRFRFSVGGSSFGCKVGDSEGGSGLVVVTVNDDKGNTSWKLEGGKNPTP